MKYKKIKGIVNSALSVGIALSMTAGPIVSMAAGIPDEQLVMDESVADAQDEVDDLQKAKEDGAQEDAQLQENVGTAEDEQNKDNGEAAEGEQKPDNGEAAEGEQESNDLEAADSKQQSENENSLEDEEPAENSQVSDTDTEDTTDKALSDENENEETKTPLGVKNTEMKVQVAGTPLNLDIAAKNDDTELYVGSDWAWNSASSKESGTAAIIDITRLGGNNGGDAIWSLQYNLKNLNVINGHTYTIDMDLTATADKFATVKFDDSGLAMDTVQLKANETKHFTLVSKEGSFTNRQLYFAIGQHVNDAGTENPDLSCKLTIENITIVDNETGESVQYTESENVPSANEYDFDNELNAENDAIDPGTTKDGYNLIWSDEFDGNYGASNVDAATGLNLDNWAYQLGDGSTDCGNQGWGNNELQAYTGRIENVGVNEDLNADGNKDGVLRITARYEKDGYNYAGESIKKYTSARIRSTKGTEALFDTTYGYIESRISVPGTQGAWPAFWMLPESTEIYGGWPVSGEIDILETVGSFGDKTHNKACGTLHWGAPEHVYKGSGYVSLKSDTTYFHTYAIDWEPGKISWIYDGEVINTLENWEGMINGTTSKLSYDAPFDQPFYMLLNLAVDSGQFGGDANRAQFKDDINMYVDYVRVYQRSEGYADSVVRNADENAGNDWQEFAGINQIADVTASNIRTAAGGNMNSEEQNSTMDRSKWYLSYQSDATDAAIEGVTRDGHEFAKVTVNTPGGQDYSVQLIGHYNAKAGYVYKVSYDAFADGNMTGKTVNCDSKEWKGWSTYGIKSFSLTSEPAHYSYYVNQTENFDDCRIEFNIGAKDSGNVYIGNVKVEIVDPAHMQEDEDTRHPLPNGEVIYNGSFDQGNNKTGYWSTANGTKVSVPRYTTTKITDSDVKVVDIASTINDFEHLSDGVKYYERRAEVTSPADKKGVLYQGGISLPKGEYSLSFDMYSAADTSVDVAVCSSEGDKLIDEKNAATSDYTAGALKTFTWNFDLLENLDEAALVFRFPKGTSVMIDNVSLIGKNLGAGIDTNPVKGSDLWTGHDGFSGSLSIDRSGDVNSLSNASSGGAWYSPQIISKDFALTGGVKYELSFKYKMEGNTNNTFEYIVQENSGSWHVFKDVTKVNYAADKADAEGYNEYKAQFSADTTLSPVHVVIGLGNSAAAGSNKFSFKDFELKAVSGSSEGQTGAGDALTDRDTKVIDDVDNAEHTEKPEDTNNNPEDNNNSGNDQGTGNENTPKTPENTTDNNKQNPVVNAPAETGTEFTSESGATFKVIAQNAVEYVSCGNKKAKSVTIPDAIEKDGVTYNVTAVADKAFSGYKKLSKVVIGSNVETIGNKAFYKCKKLSTVKINSEKITSFGSKTFKGANKKATVKVKKSVYKDYKKMISKAGGKNLKVKKTK